MRRGRRGFALLLVLLLTVSAGMVLAVMMDDAARVRRQAETEVRAYRLHHAQAGLRDMLEVAIRLRGVNLAEIRGEAVGRLTLRTAAGEEAIFELRDGQGPLLWDNTASAGPVAVRAAAILFQELGPRATELLRTRGPARVSINSADRAVLRAVIQAIDPKANAEAFADRVLETRGKKPLIEGQVPGAIGAAEMSAELTAFAARVFTADPILFRVDITLQPPGLMAKPVRYRGLLQADQRGSNPAVFLSFEAVEDEEGPGGSAGGAGGVGAARRGG
jgi:hypothetical protein